MTADTFSVRLTADFFDTHGRLKFHDAGLDLLRECGGIRLSAFEEHRPVIQPHQIGDAHAVIVLTPQVTQASLDGCENLLMIGRFGVGFDSVDVDACTERDVLVTITSGAVDRSMAEATIGWMIALSHHMLSKDRLVRTGRWDRRTQFPGKELRDRTLGIIGLGGIGRELVAMLRPFGMNRPLACDPFVPDSVFHELGVTAVSLPELLRSADFVSIHCPLNESTRGLIGRRELDMMKPDAWLLNTARGGIVDEDALFDALKEKRIAGAAIDCFENEPLQEPHRLSSLDNVILAPHSVAWTDEFFRDIGRTVCGGVIDLYQGRRPHGVLNPGVLQRPGFRTRWARATGRNPEELAGPDSSAAQNGTQDTQPPVEPA